MCGRSEDNLQESVSSFHHVRSGDRNQVVRLGGSGLYPLSPLTSLLTVFLGQRNTDLKYYPKGKNNSRQHTIV